MSQSVVTFDQLKESAVKYSKELLLLPVIGAQSTLKYMTARPGVRHIEKLVVPSLTAEFAPDAPYGHPTAANSNINLTVRDLQVFLGANVTKFDPTVALQTIYGESDALLGDAQKNAASAKTVLALQMKALSAALNRAIWSGERNANGTTTAALFDGFDTITEAEITAGNIAEANGNYLQLNEEITVENADQVIKEIMFGLEPELREQEAYIYCSQDIYDKYCEAYQANHGGLVYNTQYTQREVEGSNGLLKFVPLASKAGSQFIHIAPKFNLVYGYNVNDDRVGINVDRFDPFILTLSSRILFGVQFATLDKRAFKVIELSR